MRNSKRSLIIRRFKREDAKDVAEIFHLVDNDQRSLEFYEQWEQLPKHCVNLVAEFRGKVVGRLLVDQLYPSYQELVNFAIHPDYQGKGIGKEMVKEAIRLIEAHPHAIPFLKVDENNHVARRLYEKNKFFPAIQGTNKLHHWLIRYESTSLMKWFVQKHPNSRCIILKSPDSRQFKPRMLTIPNDEPITFKKIMRSMRLSSKIAFVSRDIPEIKLEFLITGHPDQIIGFIRETYCVPGLPPSINGVSLIEKDNRIFTVELDVKSEGGDTLLRVENGTHKKLVLTLEVIPFMNVISSPRKLQVTVKQSSSETTSFKISLEKQFNPQIFEQSSFEAIPLSILVSDKSHLFPPFHLTQFFWYRTLSST